MGFFNNDLVGNTVIEPGKWYNVVWRYNKRNGEQAIFVNGKLARSLLIVQLSGLVIAYMSVS